MLVQIVQRDRAQGLMGDVPMTFPGLEMEVVMLAFELGNTDPWKKCKSLHKTITHLIFAISNFLTS